jgi:glycosyltransferase involved in cell wall biosynthesis
VSAVLVVRIATRLNVGGPTRQIASLMARLPGERFSQILITGTADPSEGEGLIPVPGQRILVPGLRRNVSPVLDRRAFRALVARLRELRPSVVHTHQAKAGWIGRMAAAAAGVPAIVHTYHGHTFRGYFRWPWSSVFLMLERRAARRSSALIVQAAAQADDVEKFLGAEARAKIRVIAPGVEMPRIAERRPPGEGRVRVVVPARLEPIKDPSLALRVAARLPQSFEVHLFGDGSLRAEITRQAGAAPRTGAAVFLHPNEPDREALYRTADVTLLTSREEGTPLALIESQALGVPVVAPDVGAIRSVVAPGGGLVVAREEGALAEAVVAAARSGISEEAVSWVRERFDAGRMVREVAALYEDLMACARKASPAP